MTALRFASLLLLLATPLSASAAGLISISEALEALRDTTLTVRTSDVNLQGIRRGAPRVRLLPLKFTASCEEDIELKYIRVHRAGKGDSRDIKRVYAVQGDGMQRLSRSRKISTDDHTAVLRLRKYVIPACETRRIDIAVDFSRGAAVGGEFRLGILGTEDIVTNAEVIEARFPLETMTTRPVSITPDPAGVVTITFLPVSAIRVIREEVLAKFRVKAGGSRHQLLHSIMLTNEGSAKGEDLRNLYLVHRKGMGPGRALTPIAKRLGGAFGAGEDQVFFRFSRPFFLKAGQQRLFYLMGSAHTAKKTVNFGLEEPSDLAARSTRRAGRNLGGSQTRLRGRSIF